MSNTISENLQRLEQCRQNIISAIKSKGGTVTDNAGLSKISIAIDTIPQEGGTPVDPTVREEGEILKPTRLKNPIVQFTIFSDIHFANSVDNGTAPTYDELPEYNPTTEDDRAWMTVNTRLGPHMQGIYPDFIAYLGDTMQSVGGTQDKCMPAFNKFKFLYNRWLKNSPIFAIPGNHDCGYTTIGDDWDECVAHTNEYNTASKYRKFGNITFCGDSKTVYSFTYMDDLYIFFGRLNDQNFNYTQSEYDFLFNLLEANKSKGRIFLFSHWYDSEHDQWNWRDQNADGIVDQQNGWKNSDADHPTRGPFGRIANYKNVIWFCGHAHTPWRSEDYISNIKVYSHNCARLVGIPATYQDGEYAIVTVYPNDVHIQAVEIVQDATFGKKLRLGRDYLIGNVTYDGSDDTPVTPGGDDTPGTTTYTVTNNLTGCTNVNTNTTMDEGTEYNGTLSIKSGYDSFVSVNVKMGGVVITNATQIYDDICIITIPSVTGNIVIDAVCSKTSSGNVEDDWDDLSEHSGYIKCIYDVDLDEQDANGGYVDMFTQHEDGTFGYLSTITDMIVDGVSVSPAITHTFTTPGKHVVWFKFKDSGNKLHTNQWYKNKFLWSVAVPNNITASGTSAFKSIPNLEHLYVDIPVEVADNQITNLPKLKTLVFGEHTKGIWTNSTGFLAPTDGGTETNSTSLTDIYIYAEQFPVRYSLSTLRSLTYNVHMTATGEIYKTIDCSGSPASSPTERFPNCTVVRDL